MLPAPFACLFVLLLAACAGPPYELDEELVADDLAEASAGFTAAAEEAARWDSGQFAEPPACSGIWVPDRRFQKQVVLTFDDGPSATHTPVILRTLRRHGVPAAFFTNGKRFASAAAQAVAAEIARSPDYILANHGYSHANLTTLTSRQAEEEFTATEARIIAVGGRSRYFRFPYGAANCRLTEMVRAFHNRIVGWHIDSADWCYAAGNGYCAPATFAAVPDPLRNNMLGYIMSQVRARNGGIILMHDIHKQTAANLEALLVQLKAEGYTFAKLSDRSVLPQLHR